MYVSIPECELMCQFTFISPCTPRIWKCNVINVFVGRATCKSARRGPTKSTSRFGSGGGPNPQGVQICYDTGTVLQGLGLLMDFEIGLGLINICIVGYNPQQQPASHPVRWWKNYKPRSVSNLTGKSAV